MFVSMKCPLQSAKSNMSKETHNHNLCNAKANEGKQMTGLKGTSEFSFCRKHSSWWGSCTARGFSLVFPVLICWRAHELRHDKKGPVIIFKKQHLDSPSINGLILVRFSPTFGFKCYHNARVANRIQLQSRAWPILDFWGRYWDCYLRV